MPVFKCPDKYLIDGKAMELVKGYQPAGKFVPLENEATYNEIRRYCEYCCFGFKDEQLYLEKAVYAKAAWEIKNNVIDMIMGKVDKYRTEDVDIRLSFTGELWLWDTSDKLFMRQKHVQEEGRKYLLEERVQGMLKLTLEDGKIIKREHVSGVVKRKVRMGVIY